MSTITFQSGLKKSMLPIVFLLLYSLFITEKGYSRNRWNRAYVAFRYDLYSWTIGMSILFFNYEFGPRGEHGYLERMNLYYSVDGKMFIKLLGCSVKDQVQTNYSVVKMKNKLVGANLQFKYGYFSDEGFTWPENASINAKFTNYSSTAYITLRWFVPHDKRIKSLFFTGIWHVNGLNCNELIKGEFYEISPSTLSNSTIETDLKQIKLLDQVEDNDVKAFSVADVIIVEGAKLGQNIKVFNTSGTLVKSIHANEHCVNIRLPENQIYIVSIGQARYKVAL